MTRGAGTRRLGWLGTMILLPALLSALPPRPARAETGVEVSADCRKLIEEACSITGAFEVAASSKVVWDVLTDYNNLSRFIPNMRRSSIEEQSRDSLLLDQEFTSRAFFMSRMARVALRVTERPLSLIKFQDVSHRDFTRYRGSWTIEGDAPPFRAVYRLNVALRTIMPAFMLKHALDENALGLLKAVSLEIRRRSLRSPASTPLADRK